MNLFKKLVATKCSVLWVVAAAAVGAGFYYDHTADWDTVCRAIHKDRARVVAEKWAAEAKLAAVEQELLVARQTIAMRDAGWRVEVREMARDKREWEKAVARMTRPSGTEVAPMPARYDGPSVGAVYVQDVLKKAGRLADTLNRKTD